MKQFARAFLAVFGVVVLGSFLLLVPQKNAAAQGGGPTVAIGGPLPLPVNAVAGTVGINNFPSALTGTSVPVSIRKSANFKTLTSNGMNFNEVLPDGTISTATFTLSQGEQFVITDVSWVAACINLGSSSCSVSAGDAVLILLGNSYRSEATYANRFGQLFAGHTDHLTSGIVVTQMPTPFLPGAAGNGEGFTLTLQGYLVP